MRKLYDFVDKLFSDRELFLTDKARREAAATLKVAGFSDHNPPQRQPRKATRILDAFLNSKTSKNSITVASADRLTTAAVINQGEKCPRCGGEMVDVKLCDGTPAAYCTNSRCRVSGYRS